MVRTSDLVVALSTLVISSIIPADAVELASRQAVHDLHRAEQLVAAAVETADTQELRRQSFGLSRLAARLPETERDDVRINCAHAIGALMTLADDLRQVPTARTRLAISNGQREYASAASQCEVAAEIPAPSPPNLR